MRSHTSSWHLGTLHDTSSKCNLAMRPAARCTSPSILRRSFGRHCCTMSSLPAPPSGRLLTPYWVEMLERLAPQSWLETGNRKRQIWLVTEMLVKICWITLFSINTLLLHALF